MTTMTQPDQDDTDPDAMPGEVPPANPAYATPPPGGIPDADDD
jgi:hypothetical protein